VTREGASAPFFVGGVAVISVLNSPTNEREDGEEEIEFQLKWSRAGDETPDEDESNDV